MKRLFIFEGPDGTGKSTLANALTTRLSAVCTHHGAYQDIKQDLSNVYALSMMPAVLDLHDVVMDRSWLSEIPYGLAYRWGEDRLGDRLRALESLAMAKTEPLVIRCDAPFERVAASFQARKQDEYLDNQDQLQQVWTWYRERFKTSLPLLVLWPFTMSQDTAIERILECA